MAADAPLDPHHPLRDQGTRPMQDRGPAPGVYDRDQLTRGLPVGHGDVPTEGARSELQGRYDRATKEAAELRMMRRNEGGPEGMPDLELQLQVCAGALQGVEQRAADLVAKLAPVMRSHVEVGGPAAKVPDAMLPRTELGNQAAELHARLGLLEELLARAAGEVEL